MYNHNNNISSENENNNDSYQKGGPLDIDLENRITSEIEKYIFDVHDQPLSRSRRGKN